MSIESRCLCQDSSVSSVAMSASIHVPAGNSRLPIFPDRPIQETACSEDASRRAISSPMNPYPPRIRTRNGYVDLSVVMRSFDFVRFLPVSEYRLWVNSNHPASNHEDRRIRPKPADQIQLVHFASGCFADVINDSMTSGSNIESSDQ